MMQLAQLAENREIIRGEANLKGYAGGKYSPSYSTSTKSGVSPNSIDNKGSTTFPMRMITLRGVVGGEVKKEEPNKRLSDAEFQSRKERGSIFDVMRSTPMAINVK